MTKRLPSGPNLTTALAWSPHDCGAADDELALVRPAVALALDDFAGEKNVFEIEDRKVVIVKFFYSMDGYNVVQ